MDSFCFHRGLCVLFHRSAPLLSLRKEQPTLRHALSLGTHAVVVLFVNRAQTPGRGKLASCGSACGYNDGALSTAASFHLALLILQNVALQVFGWMILTQGPRLAAVIEPYHAKWAEKLRKPSRLREFSGWERLHTLLADISKQDERPILVESYQLLSSLLFVDSAHRAESRLGSRLYIWAEGSRESQFHHQPRYVLPEALRSQSRWLLTKTPQKRGACRLYQGLLKESSDIYFLYSCE